jgi:hypothetical protein
MTTLNSVPTQITAGDTIALQISLSDYPASASWVLHYTFINTLNKYTVDGTASGADHLINITAATSAAYVAGKYSWQGYVTKAAERYTIGNGTIDILPNLAAASGGYDNRSHVKKTLDALESWLETKNPAVAEYEIAGRRMKYIPITDLLRLRDRYKMELRSEEAAKNPRLAGKNKLQVRF